jgi:hypothetical protein
VVHTALTCALRRRLENQLKVGPASMSSGYHPGLVFDKIRMHQRRSYRPIMCAGLAGTATGPDHAERRISRTVSASLLLPSVT